MSWSTDYLYCGCLHTCNHVVHDITKSLDQFASTKSGNELIEDLSYVYHEVHSFIVDNGLQHSLGLSFDLLKGPEYMLFDNDTSIWDEGKDSESEDELAAGPSGAQGGNNEGTAGAFK